MLGLGWFLTWLGGVGFGVVAYTVWVRPRAVREIRAVLGRGQSDELAEITAARIVGL